MYIIKAKYGIFNKDTYNFHETGFMISIITPIIVITTSNNRGRAKQAQPGNQK